MVSIGLAIPTTRFPPVEPTWEITPLSHEPGAICMWEVGESGPGAVSLGRPAAMLGGAMPTAMPSA
jgi:hypothetical protein